MNGELDGISVLFRCLEQRTQAKEPTSCRQVRSEFAAWRASGRTRKNSGNGSLLRCRPCRLAAVAALGSHSCGALSSATAV